MDTTLLDSETARTGVFAGGEVRPEDVAEVGAPSWEDVVRLHSAVVYRRAYRLTGNPHDAEDLTQDVFVRVFRHLSTYTPGNFDGWLHRITTNLFLDQVRRKQRLRFDALSEDAGTRLADRGPSPAQLLDDRTLDGDVQSALDALPADYRAAVVLCDIDGLTYEEIAEAMGAKIGTVRSRIHRGRAQLRTALADRAPRRPGQLGGVRPLLLAEPLPRAHRRGPGHRPASSAGARCRPEAGRLMTGAERGPH